jgi:hypothetical protein
LKLTGNSSLPDYYEPPKVVVDCISGYCIIEHFSGSSPKGTLRGWRATYSGSYLAVHIYKNGGLLSTKNVYHFQDCGGYYDFYGTQISITSPNYPNFYHTNQICYYRIYTSRAKIRLEILDFQMEAQQDWFTVILFVIII